MKLLFSLIISTLFILPIPSVAQVSPENTKIAAGVIESAQTNGTARVLIWYSPEIKEPQFNQAASQLDAIATGTTRAIFDSKFVAADLTQFQIETTVQSMDVTAIRLDPVGELLMSQARDWTGSLALNQAPYSLTGAGQVVAVIDSGLDLSHPDFAGNVHNERRCICSFPNCCASGTDVVELVEHGTAVAGTIVGLNEGAPSALILPIKVVDVTQNTLFSDVQFALDLIAKNPQWGVDAINMSLGFDDDPSLIAGDLYLSECSTLTQELSAMAKTIGNLRNQGVVVVAGSGNRCDHDREAAPACMESVLSVAAHLDVPRTWGQYLTDECTASFQGTDVISGYTSHNANTDVVAPGSFISTTRTGGGHQVREGTSMATPMVSACAALLRQDMPSAPSSAIVEAIRFGSADRISSHSSTQNQQQYYRLDCLAALGWLRHDRSDVQALVTHNAALDQVVLSIQVLGERNSAGINVDWSAGSTSTFSGGEMIGPLNSDCSIDPFTFGQWTHGSCTFNDVLLGDSIEIARFNAGSIVTDPWNDVTFSVDVLFSTPSDHVTSNNSSSVSISGGPPSS